MRAQVSVEHLITDLKAVARDSEELLKASAGDASEAAMAVRNRLAKSIESAKETCQSLQEKTVLVAKKADKVVRQNPYPVAGIAFGVGLLLGVLLWSRRDR